MPITYIERVGDKKLRPFQDGVRILYRVLQLALTHNPLLMFVWPGVFLALMGMFGFRIGIVWFQIRELKPHHRLIV